MYTKFYNWFRNQYNQITFSGVTKLYSISVMFMNFYFMNFILHSYKKEKHTYLLTTLKMSRINKTSEFKK